LAASHQNKIIYKLKIMKKTAFCILFIIINSTSSWAQNHKVYCDKAEKYLKEQGTMTNGKKEGYWKFYECFDIVANIVQSEGMYKNDLKVGLWKYNNAVTARSLEKTISYVDGLEEGEFTEYYLDGAIKYKGFYVKGKKKGEGKEFYENGKIKEIENFDDGKITKFFENGKVKETGFVKYVEYSSERTGEWKEYYENGKLKSTGSYSSGYRVGKWEQYHDNGQLSATGMYKDSSIPVPDSWTTFNRSGQKDGLNIPEPQEGDYKAVCADISARTKSPAALAEFIEYYYEKRFLEMACVNIGIDNEETAKKKLQLFWNKYKTKCKCDTLDFSISNGNFLKFSISQKMPEVIELLADTYGLDVNFIDPKDGLNLLDWINQEINNPRNSEDYKKVWREYRTRVIDVGGKLSK
jgi:antitoxin component YwqK of YwqJK toxin-antitoxin module